MQNSHVDQDIIKPRKSWLFGVGWKEPRTGIVPYSIPKACCLISEGKKKCDVKRTLELTGWRRVLTI